MAFVWVLDPTLNDSVKVKKGHIDEIRTALQQVYTLGNYGPLPVTIADPVLVTGVGGTKVRHIHVNQIRICIDAILSGTAWYQQSGTQTVLGRLDASILIRHVHIQQLRDVLDNIHNGLTWDITGITIAKVGIGDPVVGDDLSVTWTFPPYDANAQALFPEPFLHGTSSNLGVLSSVNVDNPPIPNNGTSWTEVVPGGVLGVGTAHLTASESRYPAVDGTPISNDLTVISPAQALSVDFGLYVYGGQNYAGYFTVGDEIIFNSTSIMYPAIYNFTGVVSRLWIADINLAGLTDPGVNSITLSVVSCVLNTLGFVVFEEEMAQLVLTAAAPNYDHLKETYLVVAKMSPAFLAALNAGPDVKMGIRVRFVSQDGGTPIQAAPFAIAEHLLLTPTIEVGDNAGFFIDADAGSSLAPAALTISSNIPSSMLSAMSGGATIPANTWPRNGHSPTVGLATTNIVGNTVAWNIALSVVNIVANETFSVAPADLDGAEVTASSVAPREHDLVVTNVEMYDVVANPIGYGDSYLDVGNNILGFHVTFNKFPSAGDRVDLTSGLGHNFIHYFSTNNPGLTWDFAVNLTELRALQVISVNAYDLVSADTGDEFLDYGVVPPHDVVRVVATLNRPVQPGDQVTFGDGNGNQITIEYSVAGTDTVFYDFNISGYR